MNIERIQIIFSYQNPQKTEPLDVPCTKLHQELSINHHHYCMCKSFDLASLAPPTHAHTHTRQTSVDVFFVYGHNQTRAHLSRVKQTDFHMKMIRKYIKIVLYYNFISKHCDLNL